MPAKYPMCGYWTGKLHTSNNCTKWHRQRQRRPSSPPDSVSWSLRSSPSQTEERINCFAEFLSDCMDNFPRGSPPPPLQHLLSAVSPHLKGSFQNVFERQFQRPMEREVCLMRLVGAPALLLRERADALCAGDALL